MTIYNARTATGNDLVNRYAERLRARHSRRVSDGVSVRQANGLQTFGRVPITRKRAGSTRSRRAITTLMATAIMAGSTPALASAQSSTYAVRSGDTLTQIAQDHGMSIDDLLRINDIDNPDSIEAGAELRLSENNADVDDVREGDTVYEVQSGDSLTAIASVHGVSLEDLIALNDVEQSDAIYAGDFLIIPTSTGNEAQDVKDIVLSGEPADGSEAAEPAGEQSSVAHVDINTIPIAALHLVAPGETPDSIAQRWNVSAENLQIANELAEGDVLTSGEMLRIPDASWTPPAPETSAAVDGDTGADIDVDADGDDDVRASTGASLESMPVHQQSMANSSESAALSIATSYWGHQVSEWVFIENMPYHENPHRGYRGDMDGASEGTTSHGVYPKPLSAMLANYGFVGDEFYTMGDPEALKERIDRGEPVLVWMTEGATQHNRFFEWYQGERFTLVPQQHVVVAYGYDEDNIFVSDPGTGEYATYSWNAFINSWSQFDGMSMAVYPKG